MKLLVPSDISNNSSPFLSHASLGNDSVVWQNNEKTVETIFIVIAAVFIPVIVVSNGLVIVSTIMMRRLHTPDNFIIVSIALSDLMVGLFNIPVYIINEIPSAVYLIRTHKWTCILRFVSSDFQKFSLGLLVLMCVDRFVSINWPFWYTREISNKTSLKIIGVLFLVFVFERIIIYWYAFTFDEKEPKVYLRCSYIKNFPAWYTGYYTAARVSISLGIGFILSLQVAVVAWGQTRKEKLRMALSNLKQTQGFQARIASLKITVILMFAFIILWAPFLLVKPMYSFLNTDAAHDYMVMTRIPRLANSFVNALVYAYTRSTYRKAYIFLLTTPPNRWNTIKMTVLEASYTIDSRAVNSTAVVEMSRWSGSVQTSSEFGLEATPRDLSLQLLKEQCNTHLFMKDERKYQSEM